MSSRNFTFLTAAFPLLRRLMTSAIVILLSTAYLKIRESHAKLSEFAKHLLRIPFFEIDFITMF